MSNSVDLTGYHLSFDAEMTDSSDMSVFINTFNNGDTTISSNNEAETYVQYGSSTAPGTYSFSNGALNITAAPIGNSGKYTSGMISTGYSFYQNQGYFEIRAKLAPGAGFWPAFWMLGGGPTDFSSEVDLLEQPNNDGLQSFFNSVKTPTYNAGSFYNTGVDLSAGYHTYGFMWTANSVQFVFDGNYIGSAIATPAALATLKMYLMANLAVGGTGSWPGVPANGATATYSIDYIRAYSNDPSVPIWYKVDQVSPADGASTPILATSSTSAATSTVSTPVTTTPATSTPVVTTTPAATTTATTPTSSGTDTLTIGVSEDALVGDAQYRVLVDGYLTDGVYTATASHAAGQISTQTITGSWGTGPHTIGIAFLNAASDAYGNHRALYVNSIAYDGVTEPVTSSKMSVNGVTSFPIPAVQQTATPTSGSSIVLHLAEDAGAKNAQFAFFVDGTQVTYPQTVTALNGQGASQAFTVNVGQLAPGLHLAAISDLSPTAGQNLYLKGAELNGASLSADWTSTLNSSTPVHYLSFNV